MVPTQDYMAELMEGFNDIDEYVMEPLWVSVQTWAGIGRNALGMSRCQWIVATAAGVLLLSLGWLESSLAFVHTQLVPWRSGLVSNSLSRARVS
jgi:hypothetical protein